MTRFYYADGRVIERDVSIPEWAQCFTERDPVSDDPERTFSRRRYAMNRGFYGPVPADDWHENGCPCRGCVARYQVPDEPERCLGYMNGCACDDCYIRNRYG